MIDTNSAVERIKEAIADVPWQIAQAVWAEVPSDTPFGLSLRQNAGNDLVEQLSGLSPEEMGDVGEMLIEAHKCMGTKLEHTTDLDSTLRIVTAIADNADDYQAFSKALEVSIPLFPGRTSNGEPIAMHHLYDQKVESPTYDPVAQARENLAASPDGEDADYWWSVVFKEFPDLRSQPHITVNDIPLSASEATAESDAAGYNSMLGEGAGKILQSLGHSNRSGMPTDDGHLTLEKAIELNKADGIHVEDSVIEDGRKESWVNPPAAGDTLLNGATEVGDDD